MYYAIVERKLYNNSLKITVMWVQPQTDTQTTGMSVVLTSANTFAAAGESILRRTRSTESYALKDSTDIYEKIVDIEKVLGASRNEEQTAATERERERERGLRFLFSILPLASGFFLNRFIFRYSPLLPPPVLFCSSLLGKWSNQKPDPETKTATHTQKKKKGKKKNKSSFTSSSSSGPPELISLWPTLSSLWLHQMQLDFLHHTSLWDKSRFHLTQTKRREKSTKHAHSFDDERNLIKKRCKYTYTDVNRIRHLYREMEGRHWSVHGPKFGGDETAAEEV